MQRWLILKHFHTYLRGIVYAIKPHLPRSFRNLLSNYSATSLSNKTRRDPRDPYYICSCEFIRIREKEPMVPTKSCSTVPTVLCGLVPVCGSAIVRIAGLSSCSSGQPSPTYGLHLLLTGIKLVIPPDLILRREDRATLGRELVQRVCAYHARHVADNFL